MKIIVHTLKRKGLLLVAVTALIGFVPKMGLGQPWSYDFGTGTGSFTSGASFSFLPTPTSGTSYVRIGTGSGSINLENPGLASLGSNTEMRAVAPTGGSINKASIYDYTAGKVGNLKFSLLLGNSSGGTTASTGTWSLFIGDGSQYSDANTFAGNQTFTGIQWIFGSSGAITTNYRNSGSWSALGSTLFAQGNVYNVEIYFNNSTTSQTYSRGTSQSIAVNKQDIWINGSLIGDDLAKAAIADNANIDSWMFYGENSTSNIANIFLDNIEYSNTLPNTPTIPTVTTQSASNISTISVTGNGNITATGGVNPTVRGFCWDIAINPDPTTALLTKTIENGSFGTGAFTGNINGLVAGTLYKIRAYATNTEGTSYGDVITFSTLKPEPSEYPTDFTSGTPTSTTIPLTWTDAAGAVLPDGYLIKGSSVGYGSITAPVDNTAETNSLLVQNIPFGTESHTFTGLSNSTTYYFKIWPYTNSSTAINYKTDGTAPQTSATTTSAIVAAEFRSKANGTWLNYSNTWEMFVGSSWVTATRIPTSVDNVTIRDGHIVEVTTSPNPCKDLTVEANGKLWTNYTSISNLRYISVYGNIVCNGTIGNGAGNDDAISFNIAGTASSISGTGSMTITRLRKLKESSGTTELSINKDIELRFNGNAIYNDAGVANSFQVTVQAGKTINCTSGGYLLKTNDKLIIYGNITLNNTLTNGAGVNGLTIKSDATGTGSLLHNTADVPATIERYVNGSGILTGYMYHFVSVPCTPTSDNYSGIFLDSYLFDYDEGGDKWHGYGTPVDTPLDETRGFMTYAPFSSDTYLFQNPMNNGLFTASTSYTHNGSLPDDDGWNLVPNPYPSAIDWDAASGWTKQSLDAAIYILNAGLYGGTYQYSTYTYNGTGINGGSRYIPLGQAFLVHANAASQVLSMNNEVRVHNTQSFHKNTEGIIPNLLRIETKTSESSDEIIIHFMDDATENFDNEFDAYKLTGGADAPQLASFTQDGTKLSINSLPFSASEKIIPLYFSLNKTSEVTFTASGQENFTMTPPIYLEDLLLNKVIDLQQQAEYTFNYEPGQTNRFQLRFLDITATGNDIKNKGVAFYSNGKINIEVPDMEGKQATISTYDVAGRLLQTSNTAMNGIVQVNAPVATGVYIIRVVSGNKTFVGKIVVR